MDLRIRELGVQTRNQNIKTPTWDQIKKTIMEGVKVSTDGCWEWQGRLTKDGYCQIWGTGGHRMSYLAYVGPIGRGLDIDHLCRNRKCINPDHLQPETRKVNLKKGNPFSVATNKKIAAERMFCNVGHALSPENTYLRPSDGARTCRICRTEQWQRYRLKNKDKVNARKRSWRKSWREKGIRK